jgi:hypothetical protein
MPSLRKSEAFSIDFAESGKHRAETGNPRQVSPNGHDA